MHRGTYTHCTTLPRHRRYPLQHRLLWSGASLLLLLFLGSINPGHSLAEKPHRIRPDASAAGAWPVAGTEQSYSPTPAAWEQRRDEGFINRGVAKIARVEARFALETYCDGLHSIYIHSSPDINLADYTGKFVRAQYRYARITRNDRRCFRAPCGSYEEVGLIIEHLTVLTLSEEEQAHSITGCPEIP